jgi:hypothetical protein
MFKFLETLDMCRVRRLDRGSWEVRSLISMSGVLCYTEHLYLKDNRKLGKHNVSSASKFGYSDHFIPQFQGSLL